MKINRPYRYVLFLTSLLLCILIQSTWNLAIAEKVSSKTINIVGQIETNTTKQTEQSVEFWEAILKNPQGMDLANIYTNLASAYNRLGRISEAIFAWQRAGEIYQKSGNETKFVETLVDRAQAYNSLGQFARAIPLVEKAIALTKASESEKTLTTAWGVLGNSYFLSNNYDKAIAAYQKSLDLAKALNPSYTVTPLNNQVNTWLKRANWYGSQAKLAENEGEEEEQKRFLKLASLDRDSAKIAASQALKVSLGSNNLSEVKALLNLLLMSPQNKQYQQQAINILTTLPDSRSKAYSLIKLAAYQLGTAKVDSLKQASLISTTFGDWRTQSFALGELGNFYEQQKDLPVAIENTRAAVLAAQRAMALDSLYRWQWQAGRIYRQQGAKTKAIEAYTQAIASLQSIRGDIASASKDLQFDVRDEVEPVYRQLISLLLDNEREVNVPKALEVAELLKLTELQNFFEDECLETKNLLNQSSEIQVTDKAIINSLILEDKTYIILQFQNKIIKYYSIALSKLELEDKVKDFRAVLEDFQTGDQYLALCQELYNLLIKPIEVDLERLKPSELTFINDGILRNIPMATLHNGKHFLIESYPISYTLSNSLNSQISNQSQSNIIFGLTVETPSFPALPNVAIETQAVQNIIKGEKLLDNKFTESNVERQIRKRDYSIVHIATHGEFRGTINSSSLQAFDNRISLQKLESIFRGNENFVDLLALSGCQTAAGDSRSTLGIAGLAVRTGVKNVLSSLWYINDADVVVLIEDFYTQIQKAGETKAEALRKAQVKAISDNTPPAVWSSFILISS